ncbi:MAG: MmgE/PrpD family protein [Burkholderiales bacterium]|nr:MmgE/PrpD family protein [Burkholderiales bacterium]
MHIVERYSRFAVDYRAQPIDAAVLHHAKRAVVDWFAALLPGAITAPATLLERALAAEGMAGGARLALGRPASARSAALINGSAAHTAEVDDIFRDGIYHPGAPTIAAALAVAQARGSDGAALLRAVIVGYEISTRLGAAMGREHYRYFHNTGTIGCFGAAAAAAELLGLDAPRFAHALATVATFSAALQQAFRMDSLSKPLHAGRAAEAGVLAALAAAEGVTGSLDVLEGEAGYGRALRHDHGDPDWEAGLATLGRDFHITRMTFKNHACCGHSFAAIDGALALKQSMGLAARDVKHIRIGAYRATKDVAGYDDPRTPAEARFSVKYCVATALTHGNVRLAAFEAARIAHPATREVMYKTELAVDPDIDAAFPRQRAARVRIDTYDGRSEELFQPTRKGDPDAPLTDAELDDKYLELATPVLGAARAQALLATLRALEEAGEVSSLCAPRA